MVQMQNSTLKAPSEAQGQVGNASAREKVFRGLGIDPDSPAVRKVAEALYGAGLDRYVFKGAPVVLTEFDGEVSELFKSNGSVLERVREVLNTRRTKSQAHKNRDYNSLPKLNTMLDRAVDRCKAECGKVGAALAMFHPEYEGMAGIDRKELASNIGAALASSLERNEVREREKEIAAGERETSAAPVAPRGSWRVRHARYTEALGRLGQVLRGGDGKRSLLDVYGGKCRIAGRPQYANPFDDFLMDPDHRGENRKLANAILAGKESGAAAEEAALKVIDQDARRNEIKDNEFLRHRITHKIAESLVGCFKGKEPEPLGDRKDDVEAHLAGVNAK